MATLEGLWLVMNYKRNSFEIKNNGESKLKRKDNILNIFIIVDWNYYYHSFLVGFGVCSVRREVLVSRTCNFEGLMVCRRIDNVDFFVEAVLLPDERTVLVSTNRLAHGWAYQKLANQHALFRAGC